MTVTVSIKGQMVIPSDIRKKYHIKPRTKVEIFDKGKEIVIIPLPSDPIRDSRGILKGVSTKDILKLRHKDNAKETQKYIKKYGISA